MGEQGDRHTTLPEQEGSLEHIISAKETLSRLSEFEATLEGIEALTRGDFRSETWPVLHDLRAAIQLDGVNIADFWKDPEVAERFEWLVQRAYSEYRQELAGWSAHYSQFLAAHPGLLRIDRYDGPVVREIIIKEAEGDVRAYAAQAPLRDPAEPYAFVEGEVVPVAMKGVTLFVDPRRIVL